MIRASIKILGTFLFGIGLTSCSDIPGTIQEDTLYQHSGYQEDLKSPLPDFLTASGFLKNHATYRSEQLNIESQYRLWMPSEEPEKAPLVVFFHGNGGSNFGPKSINPRITAKSAGIGHGGLSQEYPTFDQVRLEAAEEPFWQSAIFLAVLTPSNANKPSSSGTPIATWGSLRSENSKVSLTTIENNAAYAQELIQTLMPYTDSRRVYFVGQSGGALFLGAQFLPRYGHLYRGGAIFLCGGETPAPDLTSRLQKISLKYKLHFQTTASESSSLKPIIADAVEAYGNIWEANPAADLTIHTESAGKHCGFSETQPTIIARKINGWENQQ